jgi:hypothetical protein
MVAISRLTRAPILLVGDLLQASREHAQAVFDRLRVARLDNEIVFEFFTVPPAEVLHEIDRCVLHWSMEISPDSHDHAVRRAQDGEPAYTNEDMEAILKEALSLRCTRVDVFFMIGLPGQTKESVMQTIDYCEHLFQIGDKRMSCFISPMGPFIDPGSRGFEDPEKFGYTLFAHTLEEHRQLLVQPTWEHILNYESKWMTRKELVDATYDAAEKLNELKVKYGRISTKRAQGVADGIRAARQLRNRLNLEDSNSGDCVASAKLKGEISRFSISTVCDKRELFWQRHVFNFKFKEIARIAARYLMGVTTP